jgi:hypothetical protein
MRDINIGILTPYSLDSKESGKTLLTFLSEDFPEFLPERFNNYEPLERKFSMANLEEALELWNYPFLWSRRKPPVQGNVWMGQACYKSHSSIYISSQSKLIDPKRLANFIKEISVLLKADFSYLHLFTQAEFDIEDYDAFTPFRQGVVTHELRNYLPNLCWATIFGSPYVELFGRDKVLSTPAFLVQELADNLFYIQLSENLFDLKSKYGEVNNIRCTVKKYLGSDAFYDPHVSDDHVYKVPNFTLYL